MHRRLLLPFSSALLATQAWGVDLALWDIPGGAPPATIPAGATVAGVSASALARGPGLNAGASATAGWRTNNYNQTAVDQAAYDAALLGGDYIEFSLTAAANYRVTINGVGGASFWKSGTSTGPSDVRLVYSLDNFATAPITAGTISGISPDSANPTSAAAAFSAGLGSTNVVIENGATVKFRLVGVGAVATSGQLGMIATADLKLLGTSEPLVVIRDLVWTGAQSAAWDITTQNFTHNGTATAFAPSDHVVIPLAGTIQVDAPGLAAGNISHTAETGTTTVAGGTLTALSLSKTGAGTLTISNSNSFSGGTTLTKGVLLLDAPNPLGTAPLTASNGATIACGTGLPILFNPIKVGDLGMGIRADSAVVFSGGMANLTTTQVVTKTGAAMLTVSGPLGVQTTSPMDFDVMEGVVTFSGSGTTRQKNLVGVTTVNGELRIGNTIVSLHGSTLEGTGTVYGDDAAAVLISRLNAGVVTVNTPVVLNASLHLDSPNGNNFLACHGVVSGTSGLICQGNGAKGLYAANTYEGGTEVIAGTLQVRNSTGSGTGTGAVMVTATGALSGNGSIAGAVSIAAGTRILPGTGTNTTATLTLASANIAGSYQVDINGASCDRLEVTGALDLTTATLDLTTLAGGATENAYVLATYGTLTGTFGLVNGLPPGYTLSYAYHNGQNNRNIALVKPVGGFPAWMAANHPSLTGPNAEAGADPDADGITNLVEFVLGTSPEANTTLPLSTTLTASNLELTFPRRDESEGDVTLKVQWSTDLATWTDIPVTAAHLVNENGAAPDEIKVPVPRPNGANGRIFGRAAVTRP